MIDETFIVFVITFYTFIPPFHGQKCPLIGHSLNTIASPSHWQKRPLIGHIPILIWAGLFQVMSLAILVIKFQNKFHPLRHILTTLWTLQKRPLIGLNTVESTSHWQKRPLIGHLLIFIAAALLQVISIAFFVIKFQNKFHMLYPIR